VITFRRVNPRQWGDNQRRVEKIPAKVRKATRIVLEDVAEMIRDGLRAAILTGTSDIALRLRAIDPTWAQRKLGWTGGPPQGVLVWTGQYAREITVLRGTNSVGVGLPRGKRHDVTGTGLADLARYLERGTRRMKPLPHWRQAAAYGRKLLRERLVKEVRLALRSD
jgi:hypothetical protein